jgi:macrophage erythroblast attacher
LQLDESNKNEQGQVQRCRARLDHLSILSLSSKDTQLNWNSVRVERILVDYMLRSSYYDTAMKLAEAANIQVKISWKLFKQKSFLVDAPLKNLKVATSYSIPSESWLNGG